MRCEYKIVYANDVKNNDRDWVVFIHGFGGNPRMWRRQVDLLKPKFNVCAVTLPGHGDNKSGMDEENDEIYNQLAELIIKDLKGMGIKEVYLISVSMGTIVANKMLAIDENFVKKSLLTGAVCGVNKFVCTQAQVLARCASFLPYKFVVNCCARILMPKTSHEKSRKFLVNECLRLSKEEFSKWISVFLKALNYAKNIRLDNLKCEMVMGDEDFVFRNGIRKISERCRLPLHVIKHCGHVCSLSKWREFNTILLDFLDSPELMAA